MSWFGMDPGPRSGWVCVLDSQEHAMFLPAKVLTNRELFLALSTSYGLLRGGVIEKVWVRPGQGLSSQAKLVLHRGQWEGVADSLGVRWELLAPQTWRKMLGLKTEKEKTKRKKANRELAQRLYPNIPLTNEKTDALLLAHVAKKIFT